MENVKNEKSCKSLYIIISVLSLIVIAQGIFLFIRLKESPETTPLSKETSDIEISENLPERKPDPNQYNWSTMNEGPYNNSVSFATSTDLLNWQDSEVILAEHASVPDVLLKDGVLYVYFVDVSTDGIPEQVGLIKSFDYGETWKEKEIITIEGVGDRVAVDPAPFLLEDGGIRLYYFDISTTKTEGLENNTMYSAISKDGVNFTQEDGIRFKYPGIFDPCVIKNGETWRMYVGTDDNNVLSAISDDGLDFTYEGVALTGGSIPNVIYENDTYYLFTGGIDISTSEDGKTFTKTSFPFNAGNLTADPGVVKLGPNNYFMVYKTKEMQQQEPPTSPG
jgi:hypothetical protein